MYFAVIYRLGPASGQDKRIWEEHMAYMRQLLDRGQLVMGGPFADEPRLMAILRADSLDEAAALVAQDPVVITETVLPEVHPWQVMLKEG